MHFLYAKVIISAIYYIDVIVHMPCASRAWCVYSTCSFRSIL